MDERAAVVGIDVGTSGVRAVVVDGRGAVVAQASRSEGFEIVATHPGWAEQSPELWWEAAADAVAEALARAGRSREILAVGLSGQMHSSVLLDAQQRVLHPALLWCDGRTDAQCRDIDTRLGGRTLELTGNLAFAGFTASKILWLRDEEPRLFEQLDGVLLAKDFIRLRLAGDVRATDVTDASGTLLFDVATRRWSDEVLRALDIDARLLPRALESAEVSAVVSASAATRTGLAAGTPIVAGAGDQAAAATGLGCSAHRACISLGTSGVVFAPTSRFVREPHGRLHAFCYSEPQSWHLMGVILSASGCQRWLRQILAPASDGAPNRGPTYSELDAEMASVAPGAEGLMWLPYLSGERTPHNDPHARGVLFGASLAHGRAHVSRAIMEGVAFALGDAFGLLVDTCGGDLEQLLISGGGARGDLACQIVSDVLGRRVDRPAVDEGPAYGAALLAGVGAELWDLSSAAARVVIERSFEPRAQHRALYDERQQRFRQLYRALRPLFAADAERTTR